MVLDVEQHVDLVMNNRLKNINLSQHLWLLGFHKIVDGTYLNKNNLEDYLSKISQQYKPFTKLSGRNFMLNNLSFIKLGSLYSVHLPINNDYHFLFALIDIINKGYKFFYEDCKNCRSSIEPYSFPHMELRRSQDFSQDKEIMKSIDEGKFFYDPRLSVIHHNKNLILKSYKTIEYLVKNTKMN